MIFVGAFYHDDGADKIEEAKRHIRHTAIIRADVPVFNCKVV